VSISKPHFSGTLSGYSSFLSLTPPPFVHDYFELKFHFLTDDSNQVALLLFMGQQQAPDASADDADDKDFMAVSFIRGHVALTWDLGSGDVYSSLRDQVPKLLIWRNSSIDADVNLNDPQSSGGGKASNN
jgi:hypothetical protein